MDKFKYLCATSKEEGDCEGRMDKMVSGVSGDVCDRKTQRKFKVRIYKTVIRPDKILHQFYAISSNQTSQTTALGNIEIRTKWRLVRNIDHARKCKARVEKTLPMSFLSRLCGVRCFMNSLVLHVSMLGLESIYCTD